MAVDSLQKQPARGPGRPFEKGRSGNPAGRRPGARNKATLAAEALFDSEAEALSRKAVELALGGSASDIAAAMGAIVKAAAQGTITPDDAFKLSQMVDTFVRAIETSDFDKRLQILENADAEKAANAVGWYGR